ncbi:hypothetical protein ACU8KH_04962 [Lachancea thermotolerans]
MATVNNATFGSVYAKTLPTVMAQEPHMPEGPAIAAALCAAQFVFSQISNTAAKIVIFSGASSFLASKCANAYCFLRIVLKTYENPLEVQTQPKLKFKTLYGPEYDPDASESCETDIFGLQTHLGRSA